MLNSLGGFAVALTVEQIGISIDDNAEIRGAGSRVAGMYST
jgi:hypothetical protein